MTAAAEVLRHVVGGARPPPAATHRWAMSSRLVMFALGAVVAIVLLVPDGRELVIDAVQSAATWVAGNVGRLGSDS